MTGILAAQPDWWTREQWLEWRLDRIGGSDVAALCGLSRFASPMSVFVDKCQLGAPREVGEAAEWGLLHEDLIAREFERRTGLFVLHAQTLAVDEQVSWRGATLDGLIAESPDVPLEDHDSFLGTCQIKCSSDYGWDELPDEYTVQCQWELGVAGFERAWVPVLHQGNHLRVYGPLEFDPRVFGALCSIADRFWTDHIAPRVPPPSDGSSATTDALKAAFPTSDGEPVELPDEVLEVAAQLPAAKEREKDARAEVQRIQNAIGAALGNSVAGGIRNGEGDIVPLVTWKAQPNNRVDLDALRLVAPDLMKKHTIEGTQRVMRQTKAFKELIEQGAPE